MDLGRVLGSGSIGLDPAVLAKFRTKTWHRHADFIRNELVHYIKNGTYRHRLDRIDGVALEVAEGEAIELLWQRSGNARTQARTQAQGSNR